MRTHIFGNSLLYKSERVILNAENWFIKVSVKLKLENAFFKFEKSLISQAEIIFSLEVTDDFFRT